MAERGDPEAGSNPVSGRRPSPPATTRAATAAHPDWTIRWHRPCSAPPARRRSSVLDGLSAGSGPPGPV